MRSSEFCVAAHASCDRSHTEHSMHSHASSSAQQQRTREHTAECEWRACDAAVLQTTTGSKEISFFLLLREKTEKCVRTWFAMHSEQAEWKKEQIHTALYLVGR